MRLCFVPRARQSTGLTEADRERARQALALLPGDLHLRASLARREAAEATKSGEEMATRAALAAWDAVFEALGGPRGESAEEAGLVREAVEARARLAMALGRVEEGCAALERWLALEPESREA